MRFEYWKTAEGVWAWHLKSSLGEIVAHGSPLPSRESCLTAIKLVKLAAGASCRDMSERHGAEFAAANSTIIALHHEPV